MRAPNLVARLPMSRARHDGRRGPGAAPADRIWSSQKARWRSSTLARRAYTEDNWGLRSAPAMARYT